MGLPLFNLESAKFMVFHHLKKEVLDVPRDEEFLKKLAPLLVERYFEHYLFWLEIRRD